MLSVRGVTQTFTGVFNGFVFPSLVVLRLLCTSLTTTLVGEDVHQAITATPALKELHLQFYEPFEITDFLRQPQGSMLAAPLSIFVPGLMMLVFDGITCAIIDSTTSDILTLLHSNDDLTTISRTQLSVEFIFDEQDSPRFLHSLRISIGKLAAVDLCLSMHQAAMWQMEINLRRTTRLLG